jgi:hypothetical protein
LITLVGDAAGTRATAAPASPKIEDNLKIEEPVRPAAAAERPRARPLRHVAIATPARKVHSGSRGAGFGARIRSIDIDGQHYEMNAPGQKNP